MNNSFQVILLFTLFGFLLGYSVSGNTQVGTAVSLLGFLFGFKVAKRVNELTAEDKV